MSEHARTAKMSELVGYAYPAIVPIGEDGRRFIRRWILRCARELPTDNELEAIGSRVAAAVEATFRSAYAEHASEEKLRGSVPGVRLGAIDQNHCVVEIELPAPAHAVGDAGAIGTWATLRAIDEALSIEDLEGLPKRMWFQLA